MDAITYTRARAHLAEMMAKVNDDHTPVLITRKSGGSVVMQSSRRLGPEPVYGDALVVRLWV